MQFNEKLKSLREAKGMTQEELAEIIGISRQSISKWELGVNEPDIATIRVLCQALGTTPNELFAEEETKEPPVPPVNETPAPAGKSLLVGGLIFAILLLATGILSLAFPLFFIMQSNGTGVTYPLIYILLGGTPSNGNILAWVAYLFMITAVVLSFLIALKKKKHKAFFTLRNVLLLSMGAIHLYLLFVIRVANVAFGTLLYIAYPFIFFILCLSTPGLRYAKLKQIYPDICVESLRFDAPLPVSALLFSYSLFAIFRMTLTGNGSLYFFVFIFLIFDVLTSLTLGTLYLLLKKKKAVYILLLVYLGIGITGSLIAAIILTNELFLYSSLLLVGVLLYLTISSNQRHLAFQKQ